MVLSFSMFSGFLVSSMNLVPAGPLDRVMSLVIDRCICKEDGGSMVFLLSKTQWSITTRNYLLNLLYIVGFKIKYRQEIVSW